MSLQRIATNLGLSVTTVSRALAGYHDVSAATRARVEAEAKRIDYHPNQIARRLRSGRSGAVGVVLPAGPGQFDDPFFLRMLAGFGPALSAAGLDLLVTTARPGADETRAFRHLVEGRRVDGMLLARTRRDDPRITYLLDTAMPFVAHGRSTQTRPFAWIDIDGCAAFTAATERLVAFGHTRIALINASDTYMYAHHREAGWRAGLAAAGLAAGLADCPMLAGEPTEESGFHLATRLLALASPPTAILCATDRIAVGCLHALTAGGLRAGRDISVIGYDNLPLTEHTDPPLTTIGQPIERAAARMAEMLIDLIAGHAVEGKQELWPASLIERASDGPVRQRTTKKTTFKGDQNADTSLARHD